MPSCRSSGVLTASSVISSERCKLISIHAMNTGAGAETTVKVFDNTAAEYDMHGVIASNGLYLEISTGTGTGAAVSVEFN